ncbi:MAG TPA: hypothetical protein VM243_20350 [Phycisphaerae bacterium]|nr:hypothetical protein [Phycisphaerae bacterium]
MNTEGAQAVRLDFGNLPLVETAVRVSLERPVKLTYVIINRVADQLRDRFPDLQEPGALERPPGIEQPSLPLAPGQLLGAVYTGNKDGIVLTLQGQVIVARWLKQIREDAAEYPRFAVLRDAVWQAVDAFRDACGGQLSGIVVVNMSYVNFLGVGHSEPVLARYFSDLAQIKAAKDARQIHKVEVSWRESESVDLRYNLEQVTAQVGDETVEGYRITTAAGSRLAEGTEPKQALVQVHQRLQVFFRSLISDYAKEEWQLKEVTLG